MNIDCGMKTKLRVLVGRKLQRYFTFITYITLESQLYYLYIWCESFSAKDYVNMFYSSKLEKADCIIGILCLHG